MTQAGVINEQSQQLGVEEFGEFDRKPRRAVRRSRLQTKHQTLEAEQAGAHRRDLGVADATLAFMSESASDVGKRTQAILRAAVYAAGRKCAVGLPLARFKPRQQRNPLVDGGDRIDREASILAGFNDVLAQHQVLDVGVRDQYALRSGKPTAGTG